MKLQAPTLPAVRTVSSKSEGKGQDVATLKGDSAHHDHGWSGAAMHIGHDVAMIGMSIPCLCPCPETPTSNPPVHNHSAMGHDHAGMQHSHSQAPAHDHSHHDHGSTAGHDHSSHAHQAGGVCGAINTAMAGLSVAVSIGSAVHGYQMLQSDDTFTKLEGVNHLVMSAGSASMAGAMLGAGPGLGSVSTGLMAAHGLGEVALGAYQLRQGLQDDCSHHKLSGATKMVHGGCLAAAQLFPGAALPLYLAMGAATTAEVVLSHH